LKLNLIKETPNERELPKTLRSFIKKYPEIWNSYDNLGSSCTENGPLTEKMLELIKIAIHGANGMFTPFKTHVRLAIKTGATPDEIEHTIIQLLTSKGISQVMMCMKWANEVMNNKKGEEL
jgi:alkylhydroperoxidase/carboxymuconolactone decarboxylase family protein YurZ